MDLSKWLNSYTHTYTLNSLRYGIYKFGHSQPLPSFVIVISCLWHMHYLSYTPPNLPSSFTNSHLGQSLTSLFYVLITTCHIDNCEIYCEIICDSKVIVKLSLTLRWRLWKVIFISCFLVYSVIYETIYGDWCEERQD